MEKLLLFFFILSILIILILFSKVKIFIKTKQSITEKNQNRFVLEIIIYIFVVNKLKLEIYKTTSDKLKSKKFNKTQYNFDKDIVKLIKESNSKIEKLLFEINFDTQDIFLTTSLTVIIAIIVSYILKINSQLIMCKNLKYKINPLYQNKNYINLKLDCIITADFVHIIITLYKLIKKVRNYKYERTPSRGFDGYSNE